MAAPLTQRFSLNDLRVARASGRKVPVLTCYDFSTARLMSEAGVPALLVGDSAASVILGHDNTLPVPLDFMIEITAAVRRGAPLAFVMADMPFGSFGGDVGRGFDAVCKVVKLSGCDCVKIEAADQHMALIRMLSGAGVAVVAHLGLRPQSIGLLGGYKYQGRTAADAETLADLAVSLEAAGAAALLIEAVPDEVGELIVGRTSVPVIGCGAGPACTGFVVVTHDALGYTKRPPRFVPQLSVPPSGAGPIDAAGALREAFGRYVELVTSGQYPTRQHAYPMLEGEAAKLAARPRGTNIGSSATSGPANASAPSAV
jgi:3-methyl-2-oxobutanoate hydroxymethyltransferase